jgi:hypothetical protein
LHLANRVTKHSANADVWQFRLKSFNTKPCHYLCNMAIDEDEKEIPQEEKLVEETEAVDEEENDDIEREED